MKNKIFSILFILIAFSLVAAIIFAVAFRVPSTYLVDAHMSEVKGCYNFDTLDGDRYVVSKNEKAPSEYRVILKLNNNGTPKDKTDDTVVTWYYPSD